jgi:hypothetical protein
MRAFKVHLNGKKLCTAGIGGDCVLSAIVNYVAGHGRAEMFLQVGGLDCSMQEHVRWVEQKPLRVGDEIRIKIIDVDSVDAVVEKHQTDPVKNLEVQKRYVRRMAKELGWKIQAQAKK